MASVFDVDHPALNGRVGLEVGAEKIAVPWPVLFRVGRRMNSGEATSRTNETL